MKKETVNVKCVVHSSSLRRSIPLVMISTVEGEVVISPPREILSVMERISESRVFNCYVVGAVIKDKGETLLVRLKSDDKDVDIEVSNKEVEEVQSAITI